MKIRNRTSQEARDEGGFNPIAIELEGQLRWKQSQLDWQFMKGNQLHRERIPIVLSRRPH